MGWLLEPLQFEFMQQAVLMAVLVGTLGPVVGSYLLVQRLALLGDVISHTVLPGLAIAFWLGGNIYVGAFVAGVLSTLLMAGIERFSRLKADTAMGIVLSGGFALGITLITLLQKHNRIDLSHFLFGNILSVTRGEVIATGVVTLVVLGVIRLFYKELLFYTFDPLGAAAAGVPVNHLHWGLMMLVALTVVMSLKAVGVVLVIALLVTPAATAYLVCQQLHQVMLTGIAIGVLGSVGGMYLSYYLNIPSGPGIVLLLTGFFVVVWLGLNLTKGINPSL
ncbi:MAG: metal ABC transporter permease [Thermostichales cyanobacterium GMQP_bins_62]